MYTVPLDTRGIQGKVGSLGHRAVPGTHPNRVTSSGDRGHELRQWPLANGCWDRPGADTHTLVGSHAPVFASNGWIVAITLERQKKKTGSLRLSLIRCSLSVSVKSMANTTGRYQNNRSRVTAFSAACGRRWEPSPGISHFFVPPAGIGDTFKTVRCDLKTVTWYAIHWGTLVQLMKPGRSRTNQLSH